MGRILDRAPSVLARIYALSLIGVGWVIFASDGSTEGVVGLEYFARLLGIGCAPLNELTLYEIMRNIPFALIMAVGCTPLPRSIYLKIRDRHAILCDIVAPLGAFVISVAYIVSSGYDPFLYFRF